MDELDEEVETEMEIEIGKGERVNKKWGSEYLACAFLR